MKITGIIAEYNPFHNGHFYQINKAKEHGTDYIIVIMSGNFLQRGTPAVFDKWTRTQMALSCGADLVIELPSFFATASAQYFARGGVSILDKLGCVDTLSFGCEADDISMIKMLSSFTAISNTHSFIAIWIKAIIHFTLSCIINMYKKGLCAIQCICIF
jgi:cytidyltransferase-like protein